MEITRRDFVLGSAAALLLVGCGSDNPARDRLVQDIKNLPDTLIKRGLLTKVLPIWQGKSPQEITLGGHQVTIFDRQITEKSQMQNPYAASGEFNPRFKFPDVMYTPVTPINMKYPLIEHLIEDEMVNFPPEHRTPDGGSVLASFEFPLGAKLAVGLAPSIRVLRPTTVKPELKELTEALTTFGYVKEACSHLFDLVRTEVGINAMNEAGLPVQFLVRDPQGKQRNVEMATSCMHILSGKPGRWVANSDLAGYLWALKALQGTKIIPHLDDPSIVSVLPAVQRFIPGSTERELYSATLRWIRETPQVKNLVHQGNISQLP